MLVVELVKESCHPITMMTTWQKMIFYYKVVPNNRVFSLNLRCSCSFYYGILLLLIMMMMMMIGWRRQSLEDDLMMIDFLWRRCCCCSEIR